jgi:thermostable 8-oxoguanine DNA glycosylase
MGCENQGQGHLNDHLSYNLKFDRVQSSRNIYLSVEDCLQSVCEEADVSLGTLDRMLFNFAGMTAIEYLMGIDLPAESEPA